MHAHRTTGEQADLWVHGHLNVAKCGLEDNSFITQATRCQCRTAQGCKDDPMLEMEQW